jgi:putative ABC transport system permease protein
MGQFSDKSTNMDKAVSEMKMVYPELTIGTEMDMYNNNLGGSVKTIDSMKNLIVTVVLGIIFLITCLIVRMLISREISEIALLKSIGFRSNQLRRWQIGRIAIILILSIILGTFLAGTLGGLLINAAFSIMGATQVNIVIEPLQVYLIYPAVLLASTILAAAISIGLIRKTKVWEINNQE